MPSIFKRISKILLGVLALPICIGVSLSLYEYLSQIKIISYYQQKYFILGMISYLIVHAVVFKPSYLYVLSHELMHAIATLLSGGRVRSIKVSSRGGSVKTTKSNMFIALSPYFFPLYTIIIALLWLGFKFLLKTDMNYGFFMFAIGFTLAFHIVLTIDFLKIRQTDLLHAGYLFSICLIYIINLVIVGLIFSFLFKSMVFIVFLQNSYVKTSAIYVGIFRQLFL
jgi:hypothetical protein